MSLNTKAPKSFTMVEEEGMNGHVEEFAWERILETKEANTQFVLQLSNEDAYHDGVGEKLVQTWIRECWGGPFRPWGPTYPQHWHFLKLC